MKPFSTYNRLFTTLAVLFSIYGAEAQTAQALSLIHISEPTRPY